MVYCTVHNVCIPNNNKKNTCTNVSIACFLDPLSHSSPFFLPIHQRPIHIVTERNSINRFICQRWQKEKQLKTR